MYNRKSKFVSVPIRGLLNLTGLEGKDIRALARKIVSVPIRGLLNLTLSLKQ